MLRPWPRLAAPGLAHRSGSVNTLYAPALSKGDVALYESFQSVGSIFSITSFFFLFFKS